jgi:dethiobiotin synthetase
VGNQIDPAMLRADDNLTTLRSRLRAPCLGLIPHMATPNVALAASFLELPS